MSGYSEKNGLEGFVYHYRVAGDGPGTYSCVPRLSFGGREFAAEPYVVTVKPASAAVSFGRWWLYVPVGALLALWGAVFVRDHTVAGQQECRRVAVFMARVYAPRPCPALRRVQRRVPVPPGSPRGQNHSRCTWLPL